MKIIDLLNRIAKGEEVPNFWWNGCIHEVQKEYGTNKYSIFDTYCKKYKKIELEDLNDEIKFLEEEKKIPMKIYWKVDDDTYTTTIGHKDYKGNKNNFEELSDMYRQKINEIIDYLDYLKSKGE